MAGNDGAMSWWLLLIPYAALVLFVFSALIVGARSDD